ncbi:uncharacterized protein LOC132639341 [Lycium barbarum]|uniref:uncharacterized protein LOC132639341 n=1 Tax=Lycium barbarum TaxID=112863 RepID=UPI00293E3FB6|nr:uncharacterized protein LOC132639341 [Lycium barbarum]
MTQRVVTLHEDGKILQGADIEEVHSDAPIIDEEVHGEEKVTDTIEVAADTRKHMIKGALHTLTQMYKAKPPFSQRMAKKNDDAKCQKFYDQLKKLIVNFSFLDAVKEMPEFAKFMKDLLTNKRSVQHETVNFNHRSVQHEIVNCTHHVSLIIASTTVKKKGDPGAFTIPCNIGLHAFAHALCDNEASINLMPLAIFKQSGLGKHRLTSTRLQMAERSIKKPDGVIDDVLVQEGKFMKLADFVIQDCAVDRDIPIILEKPFLATGRALMDFEKNEIKFRVNNE